MMPGTAARLSPFIIPVRITQFFSLNHPQTLNGFGHRPLLRAPHLGLRTAVCISGYLIVVVLEISRIKVLLSRFSLQMKSLIHSSNNCRAWAKLATSAPRTARQSYRDQSTVNTSELLVPPLVQPKSDVFPPGVFTFIFTDPGAETMSVVIFTFNCVGLSTVALKVVELTTTSEDETKLLPFTVTHVPDCKSEKLTVLGESELIWGAGLELPHNGLSVLPQPESTNRANKLAVDTPSLRPNVRDHMRSDSLKDGWPC
jgi:hypothetical protein